MGKIRAMALDLVATHSLNDGFYTIKELMRSSVPSWLHISINRASHTLRQFFWGSLAIRIGRG
jgi:hypothetical protein